MWLTVCIWIAGFVCALEAQTGMGGLVMETTGEVHSLMPLDLGCGENCLFVGSLGANRIVCFDTKSRKLGEDVAFGRLVFALSRRGTRMYLAELANSGPLLFTKLVNAPAVDAMKPKPMVNTNGQCVYVCNRFENEVSVVDLGFGDVISRIPVQREPVAMDLTKDGRFLLVANRLPKKRADAACISAVVSVIDTAENRVVKELELPNGSTGLNDIRVSPDGKYAVVSHVLARFQRPASTAVRGWMNVNALTIIDLSDLEIWNTALLDDPDQGAADPWGVAWSSDSTKVVVTHAGTHEISIIDFPMLLEQRPKLASMAGLATNDPVAFVQAQLDRADNLPFLRGSRRRVRLPDSDRGPRAVTIVGKYAYVANYFSDTLSIVNIDAPEEKVESVPLGPKAEMSKVRKGEFYFHDAGICRQGWQTCATCHPDGRTDGLNWDLLNDGMGNPKNTKSLLLAHATPPSMSLGIRESAEMAVRSGIRNILFTEQPEEVASAIDEYLKSLKPVPSPHLILGKLSEAAERGKTIFNRSGCADCHPPGLFTNMRQYDVGTRGLCDKPTDRFDTPTLVELWRTAPYLHDGSALTVREVVTSRNPHDEHGVTSSLSPKEIDDLCEYLLSL